MQSILIVQTKLIGDLVLASVLSRNLRLAYPQARIVFLCDKQFAPFVLDCRIADEVIPLDRACLRRSVISRINALLATTRRLRRQHFDLGIDLSDSRTARNLLAVARPERNVVFWPPLPGRDSLIAEPDPVDGHTLDRYLSPLQVLGIERRVSVPALQAPPADMARMRAQLDAHGLARKSFVAVHAGASSAGRRWPAERFAAAIDHLRVQHGYGAVLVGGAGEGAIAEAVVNAAASPVVDLAGRLSLRETLAVLAEARLFLGNESGPMHMAAASGTPVVGLFGLTDPARWGPLGAPNVTVRARMPCPCLVPAVCGRPDPSRAYCVRGIDLPSVLEALDRLIAQSNETPAERASA